MYCSCYEGVPGSFKLKQAGSRTHSVWWSSAFFCQTGELKVVSGMPFRAGGTYR